MSLYLYGITSHPEPVDFGTIGFGGLCVRSIPLGKFAAVIGPPPRDDFRKVPRGDLVKLLLAHQETLEGVMNRFFVLPCRFGTVLGDERELMRVLSEGGPLLTGLIDRMKDCAEIDVVATWEVPQVLREISEEDPEILAAKRGGDRAFVGMLLARVLSRQAEAWRRRIIDLLQAHAEGSADHDLLNDEMVLNCSFLIQCEREARFFQGVDETDRLFNGRLHFKCVGPLPPYSFATVTIKRFDPCRIEEARRILGLNGSAELAQVKKNYKELSRQLHPDSNPEIPAAEFERLNQAYALLADYCREGPRPLEKEAVEKVIRLEVMEKSDGV